MHLSKAHEDQDTLVVHLVTPTAGVFDDDEIDFDIQVEAHARLTLTTPSSSRIYRSRQGKAGKVTQRLRIGSGSFLEYYPEPFIPHSGARYHQHNQLHLSADSGLIFFEWLSPGRVASGESFQYQELLWDTDVYMDEKLTARERYTLNPADESISSLTMTFPNAHYIGCYLNSIPLPIGAIQALNCSDVFIGSSDLPNGGHTIKAICNGALAARKTISTLRKILYASDGKIPPNLGRFGG